MEILHNLTLGFGIAFSLSNLLFCLIGVTIGTLIGVLPGIGPVATISLLLPVTFGMSPVSSIIMLAGVYYGALYGGSTTSILVNIPGEPASVVTCLDGYQMARKGRAGPALGMCAFGSFIGGTVSVIGLMLFAPFLAEASLKFGPTERFGLMVFGLAMVTYLCTKALLKGLIMAVAGLAVSLVGTDPIGGVTRFTWGSITLMDGVGIVPAAMGMFGIAEVLANIEDEVKRDVFKADIRGLFPTVEDWIACKWPIVRASLIGFVMGIIPGVGAAIPTFIAYTVEKRLSRHPEKFGTGVIEGVADGSVPGWVVNQFSMDENEGYFRIATTTGHAWGVATSKNNVYVLDDEMKIVGTLEDLAPGEQIYSARFMGDRLYLVTFKKVDPLFVIDLSEPTAPKVLGKLKIPGYSDYLHPYDETHVIGLGKDAVDAEEGNFAWYQGVKLSLFDVSDVEHPVEVAKLEIGDRGTDSPALSDHRAFLFSRERSLLVIPILEAAVEEGAEANTYGDYVYQGAYVFQIDTEGITLRGRITHLEGDELLKSGYWFDSDNSIYRSLYIDENLYTISGAMIKINSLGDLSELKTISLE